jgi:hypothetical protein
MPSRAREQVFQLLGDQGRSKVVLCQARGSKLLDILDAGRTQIRIIICKKERPRIGATTQGESTGVDGCVENRIGAEAVAVKPVVVAKLAVLLFDLAAEQILQPVEVRPLPRGVERSVSICIDRLALEAQPDVDRQVRQRFVDVIDIERDRRVLGRIGIDVL